MEVGLGLRFRYDGSSPQSDPEAACLPLCSARIWRNSVSHHRNTAGVSEWSAGNSRWQWAGSGQTAKPYPSVSRPDGEAISHTRRPRHNTRRATPPSRWRSVLTWVTGMYRSFRESQDLARLPRENIAKPGGLNVLGLDTASS